MDLDLEARARVNVAWDRIEAVLERVQPGLVARLASAATDFEIASLENAIGFALPADVRASLKRRTDAGDMVLFEDLPLLSIEEIQSARVSLGTGTSTTTAFPKYRVPLAGDGTTYLAVDVARGGAPKDRIVLVWPSGDVVRYGASWADVLERRCHAVESDDFAYVHARTTFEPKPSTGLELESQPRLISRNNASEPSTQGSGPGSEAGIELVIEHTKLTTPPPPRNT